MRELWKEACASNSIAVFNAAARERSDIYNEVIPELLPLVQQLDKSMATWKAMRERADSMVTAGQMNIIQQGRNDSFNRYMFNQTGYGGRVSGGYTYYTPPPVNNGILNSALANQANVNAAIMQDAKRLEPVETRIKELKARIAAVE